MYVVIFTAQTKKLDSTYHNMAEQLRDLAIKEYGCKKFLNAAEDDHEITLSYWDNLDDIKRWKANALHLSAQENGKSKWYKNYSIDITEVVRHYEVEN